MAPKNTRIHLKIYLIIVLVFIIAISFFAYKIINKKTLDNEVTTVLNKNVLTDKFTTKTKTMGQYRKVELAIKKYMQDYTSYINKANNIINDDSIKNILSAENYTKDKPDFNNSFNILTTKTAEFNNLITNLQSLTNKEKILSYIENEKASNEMVNLYKNYLFGKNTQLNLENNKTKIVELQQKGLQILQTDQAVITLLKNNPNSWVVKEKEIYFYSNAVMNEYNNLISVIKNNME